MDGGGGWVGHDGSFAGHQGVAMHHPAAETTVVVLTNTDDIVSRGAASHLAWHLMAEAITEVIPHGLS